MSYTEAQAAQMRADTVIESNGIDNVSQVHVHATMLSESDPAWFMDVDWLEWFAAEHPEWTLASDLIDLYADDPLYLWMAVLTPTGATLRPMGVA